jgi:hypothetical protein
MKKFSISLAMKKMHIRARSMVTGKKKKKKEMKIKLY